VIPLGVAFVLRQTYVTGAVAEAIRQDDHCWITHGRRLSSAVSGRKDQKWDIVAIEEPKTGGAPYNVAEVINAFANYFEHRDEWTPADWTRFFRSEAEGTNASPRWE